MNCDPLGPVLDDIFLDIQTNLAGPLREAMLGLDQEALVEKACELAVPAAAPRPVHSYDPDGPLARGLRVTYQALDRPSGNGAFSSPVIVPLALSRYMDYPVFAMLVNDCYRCCNALGRWAFDTVGDKNGAVLSFLFLSLETVFIATAKATAADYHGKLKEACASPSLEALAEILVYIAFPATLASRTALTVTMTRETFDQRAEYLAQQDHDKVDWHRSANPKLMDDARLLRDMFPDSLLVSWLGRVAFLVSWFFDTGQPASAYAPAVIDMINDSEASEETSTVSCLMAVEYASAELDVMAEAMSLVASGLSKQVGFSLTEAMKVALAEVGPKLKNEDRNDSRDALLGLVEKRIREDS